MPDPSFRFASSDDTDALVALIERAYRGPETAGQWDSESHLLTGPRTSHDEIAGLIARVDSRILVCEHEARIIGCALVQRTDAEVSGAVVSGAYFGMFATDPAIRAAGLGKLILAEAENSVRGLWNASAMVMTVISVREALIAWYERRGYRLTGARIPFPFSENSGALRRDFDLVELRKDFA
jgi:ribosomal protein S18 acetylase RimI-like enzyme